MNKTYKVVWNTQLACWQVVSKLAKNHQNSQSATSSTGSQSSFSQKIGTFLLMSLALLPLSIQAAIHDTALPTGGTVTSGSAQMVQNGNTLNIN